MHHRYAATPNLRHLAFARSPRTVICLLSKHSLCRCPLMQTGRCAQYCAYDSIGMCEQHSTWCTAHLIWICLPPGAKGDALERAASDRTNGLVPKHTYVPWLVVEGVPLLDGYEHLQKFICVALPADARWGPDWLEICMHLLLR